ncbi:MAG: 50S ribosomal protein L3 [bacterium JZ-2024 1]
MKGIGWVGKKVGMTTVRDSQNQLHPATVVEILPSHILRIKTPDKDKYSAVVIGYDSVSEKKMKKPLLGEWKKRELPYSYRHLVEFRVEDISAYKPGMEWTCPLKEGDKVDVTGWTKGRGFQGVVKRYRFSGAPDSHGVSVVHRRPMSAGCRWPQRVIRGKRMPGHMGMERKTVKNLMVVKVENGKIYLRGAVPGAPNGVVFLRMAGGNRGGSL